MRYDIIGNDDGVLCVPFDQLQSMLKAAKKIRCRGKSGDSDCSRTGRYCLGRCDPDTNGLSDRMALITAMRFFGQAHAWPLAQSLAYC